MLLAMPTDILIIIFIIIVALGSVFIISVMIFNARQNEEINKIPDEPEPPNESQETEPIDNVEAN